MLQFFQKYKKNNHGFTLVEALVAISIFSFSVLSLVVILGKGIADTGYAKRKETASYLAQEGIEYMRNMRDTFVLYSADAQTGWDAFNAKVAPGSSVCAQTNNNGCYFSDLSPSDFTNPSQPITNLAVTACGSNCPTLLYDSATGKYNYTSGTGSGFIRKIRVSRINADETKVFSTVYWSQPSGSYNITFSESLYNWIE